MPANYKLYPHNWLTEIRPAILVRAGAIPEEGIEANCERCGVENHSNRAIVDARGAREAYIVLTIAHLDQDRENNDPLNLAALCQRCHLNWDRPFNLINASITREKRKKQQFLPGIDPKEWRERAMAKMKGESFNVVLSKTEYQQLIDLKDFTGLNMSINLRMALASRHQMVIQQIPTCASAQSCMAPQLFTPRAPIPQGVPS